MASGTYGATRDHLCSIMFRVTLEEGGWTWSDSLSLLHFGLVCLERAAAPGEELLWPPGAF